MGVGDEPVNPTETDAGGTEDAAGEGGGNGAGNGRGGTPKSEVPKGEPSRGSERHWLDYANFSTSVIVLIVAFAGFALTTCQISRAADQIAGATLYQLGKDGRELMREQREGKALPVDILSYFHSAYLLHERGIVDEEGWKPLRKAYCRYIQASEPAREYLETYRDLYDSNFNTFSNSYEEGAECV